MANQDGFSAGQLREQERVRKSMVKTLELAGPVMEHWTRDTGGTILEVRLKVPEGNTRNVQAIVKAKDAQGMPYVAFGGGSDVADALVDVINRLAKRTLKWRDDVPYDVWKASQDKG